MPLTLFQRAFIFVVVAMVLTTACDSTKIDSSSGELQISIEHSSGDDYSYADDAGVHYFAPYPFAQSNLVHEGKSYEVILLSKKVKKGDNIGIEPIAQFTVKMPQGASEEVVVAVPLDDNRRLFDDIDFFGFTVEKFAYKQLIEHWYANKSGLEGTLVENWRPASIATLSL